MNGLLAWMLESLGFNVYEGLARVVKDAVARPSSNFQGIVSSQNPGRTHALTHRTHRIIFAEFGGETWLCDVGYGGMGMMEPVLVRAYDDLPSAISSSWGSSSSSSSNAPFTTNTTNSSSSSNQSSAPDSSSSIDPHGFDSPFISHQGATSYRIRYGIRGSSQLLPRPEAGAHALRLPRLNARMQPGHSSAIAGGIRNGLGKLLSQVRQALLLLSHGLLDETLLHVVTSLLLGMLVVHAFGLCLNL